MKKENKLTKYNNEEISLILDNAESFSDVLRKLGYDSITTGNYKLVKGELKNRGIEVPIYKYVNKNSCNFSKSNEELFVEYSVTSRTNLKRRILRDNLIKYECECGNQGEWQGRKLILQLEHKNGNTNDDKLENLTFLCPNCHSQTSTFSGKNTKREPNKKINKCKCGKIISPAAYICTDCYSKNNRITERPSYEQLKSEIKETSQNKVAKKYNVSWRTIRKWLIYYEKI